MSVRPIAVIAAAALALLAGPARADRVMPPPEVCPDGARGESSHCGPFCQPWTCASDADCMEGSCQDRSLCIEVRQCSNRGRYSFEQSLVTGACGQGAPCATGTCQPQRVCVRGLQAPAAPTPPPPAPPPQAPPPQAPPPAPQAEQPPATPPPSAGGEQGSGCQAAPAAAGDAAPIAILAALLAGAAISRLRRRTRA